MASVYARKGILQIKFKTKDGWKQKSTGLKDTPENRRIVLNQLIPALEFKLKEKEKEKAKIDFEPFVKFADLYLLSKEGLKTYFEIQSRVEKICMFFKNRDIRSIKVSELRAWIAQFNLSSKTIKSYIIDCRGIFDIAIQEEVLDKNPFVHIKFKKSANEEKEDIQPFTAKEVERILKAAPVSLKNYLAIGFYTGMRSGEILGLQVSDIDFTSNIISVRRSISRGIVSTPKTLKSVRDIPLFNVLKPYIINQIQLAKKDRSLFLFSSKGKYLYSVDSIRGKKLYGPWYKLLKELYIPYRKIYNTRHTFITAMLKTGQLSVLEIAQMVGHTNPKMILEKYAKFIKGEHLKISINFDPFEHGDIHGDTLGDTYRSNIS